VKCFGSPLHPMSTSMPSTCAMGGDQLLSHCNDCLMYLLYSGGSEQLLRGLIQESMQSIAADFPSDGVRESLRVLVPRREVSLAGLRVLFFLLLNQDSRMRTRLCRDRLLGYLPVLCPYKACSFYELLKEKVVLLWIKDERISLLDFEERLKDAYLVA
jgi:hypothetical protein